MGVELYRKVSVVSEFLTLEARNVDTRRSNDSIQKKDLLEAEVLKGGDKRTRIFDSTHYHQKRGLWALATIFKTMSQIF